MIKNKIGTTNQTKKLKQNQETVKKKNPRNLGINKSTVTNRMYTG